jgi:hypothetical protein
MRSSKVRWVVMLAVSIALLIWSQVTSWSVTHSAQQDAEFRAQTLIRINDSTTARYLRTKAERDSLKGLFDAAKKMRGKLIAGVKVHVPAETLSAPIRDVPTTVRVVDTTRVGILEDSTRGYRLTITTVAPPFPAELRIGYDLQTPEFNPEIGIVQRRDGHYAVVSWNGHIREAHTGYSFYEPPKPRRVLGEMGAQVTTPLVGTPGVSADVFAGLRLRHPHGESSLLVGHRGRPYLGYRLIKTF